MDGQRRDERRGSATGRGGGPRCKPETYLVCMGGWSVRACDFGGGGERGLCMFSGVAAPGCALDGLLLAGLIGVQLTVLDAGLATSLSAASAAA